MAIGPSTVWMVHGSTAPGGVRGELTLHADTLIFRPELRAARLDTLGETVVALAEVTKVARPRRSPVLELHVTTEGVSPVVHFYFVKPPDLYSSGAANPRSAAAMYMLNANTLYDEEVGDWVRGIRSAVKARGRKG